jgi:putative transposase
MNRKITLSKIAELKGVSHEAIRKRRLKENWKSCGSTVLKFGKAEVFTLKNLPDDIRCLFTGTATSSNPSSEGNKAPIPDGASDIVWGHTQPLCAPLLSLAPHSEVYKRLPSQITASIPEEGKRIGLARMDLLRAWQDYRKNSAKKTDGDKDFLPAYNNRLLCENVFDILGGIQSINTFYRWADILGDSLDWTKLVPGYFFKDREGSQLSPEEHNILLRLLLNPLKLRIGTATRLAKTFLKNQGRPSTKADRTFRRHAEEFRAKRNDLWVFLREGQKALRDKVEPFIVRDPSVLEVGQVLVVDGHRLNFSVVNPFTGKPCRAVLVGYLDWKSYDLVGYEVMIEENTQCIASALRNSIIRLGKKPEIVYLDNGAALRARYFTSTESFEELGFYGLYGRLGVMTVFAKPYGARSKIIERWFREFSDTCERLIPSFMGSSIEDKPAWLLRNERFHKDLHAGYIPTISEAIEMIDAWLSWHREQPCPHVEGKTIGQVFDEGRGPGVDIAELDDLMMAMEIKTINRNGITFLGQEYYDDSLYGLRESVIIRYSLFDLSSIKVFSMRGEYLCTASRVPSVHPMAQHLGDAKDMETFKREISKQKRLERRTIQDAKEFLNIGKPVEFDWQRVINTSPRILDKLEKAEVKLIGETKRIPDEMITVPSAEIYKIIEPEIPETASDAASERPLFKSEVERFQWHLENGVEGPEDTLFMEEFKKSSLYKMLFTWFEEQQKEVRGDSPRAATVG